MRRHLEWLFATPRRLYSAIAVGGAVLSLLAVTVVGVRFVTIKADIAERRAAAPAATASPDAGLAAIPPGDRQYLDDPTSSASLKPAITPQQVAVQAVKDEGLVPGMTSLGAQDGMLQLVDVQVPRGVCTVALIRDAQNYVLDTVTCPPPA